VTRRDRTLARGPARPYRVGMDTTSSGDFDDFGSNLRRARERRGMQRPGLSLASGIPVDTIKRYENGTRRRPGIQTVARLAAALGMNDMRDLIGGPVAMPLVTGHGRLPVIDQIRTAVVNAGYAPAPDAPVDLDRLRARVDAAWLAWHQSPYQRTQVGELVPDLLADGHAAIRAGDLDQRRRAHALLTHTYALVQLLIGYCTEADLYWLTAGRVMAYAEQADDPLTLGLAAWCDAIGKRYGADPGEAVAISRHAIDLLKPLVETEQPHQEAIALIGSHHLLTAVAHSQEQREGDAWRAWDAADQAAQMLPEGYWHRTTVFSRSNVDVHFLALHTELGHGAQALDKAATIDPFAIPSTERASRALIDQARNHHQRGEDAATVNRLQTALRIGPENTIVVPAARSLVAELGARRPASLAHDIDTLTDRFALQGGEA
jgi:hypothetical protein